MALDDESWARRWNRRAAAVLAYIAAAVLAALALMTFADVVARYLFNRPFIFSVEVTELAMGLIVYFGVGLTTHERAHVSVDVLTLRASERGRALLELVTGLLALGFLGLMIWRLWLRAGALFAAGDQTQVWAIPLWPVAYAMAAAAALLFTGVALHTLAALTRLAHR
jgi:C4-dicarboxylate transporter DctQ subunit